MKIIYLIIFTITSVLITSDANATSLEPFTKWEKTRPNWAEDDTEVAYALTRCGALIGIIGGVFSGNPSGDKDLKTGEEMRKRGLSLALIGSMLAQKKGMNQEGTNKRYMLLMEAYGNDVRNNRAMHNNMFHGYIEGDYKFCIGLESAMK